MTSPAITQVHNSILATTQLSPKLRLACEKTNVLLFYLKEENKVWTQIAKLEMYVGWHVYLWYEFGWNVWTVHRFPAVWTIGGFGGDSPCSSTSLRERLSRDRRASRGAWSFLTRSHRSSVRSRRPVCPSSNYKQQHITSHWWCQSSAANWQVALTVISFLFF